MHPEHSTHSLPAVTADSPEFSLIAAKALIKAVSLSSVRLNLSLMDFPLQERKKRIKTAFGNGLNLKVAPR